MQMLPLQRTQLPLAVVAGIPAMEQIRPRLLLLRQVGVMVVSMVQQTPALAVAGVVGDTVKMVQAALRDKAIAAEIGSVALVLVVVVVKVEVGAHRREARVRLHRLAVPRSRMRPVEMLRVVEPVL